MSDLLHFSADSPHVRSYGAPSEALSKTGLPVDPEGPSPQHSQQFMGLLKAYRRSGGLLRAQDAAARCKPRGGTDVPTLAGWMVHRQVICFEWLSRIWLPVFQFNRADMSRQSGLDEVLSELVEVYDNLQIARWFSQPNARLADVRPADLLAADATDVIMAARFERITPTVSPGYCY